jgi:hypothetical protein
MTASYSELGEALLRDPLANVNNAALLLAAMRPDGDPVRTCDSAAGRGCRLSSALHLGGDCTCSTLVTYRPTALSRRPQEDVSAAILALLVFFLDACERGQLTRPVRPTSLSLVSFFPPAAQA